MGGCPGSVRRRIPEGISSFRSPGFRCVGGNGEGTPEGAGSWRGLVTGGRTDREGGPGRGGANRTTGPAAGVDRRNAGSGVHEGSGGSRRPGSSPEPLREVLRQAEGRAGAGSVAIDGGGGGRHKEGGVAFREDRGGSSSGRWWCRRRCGKSRGRSGGSVERSPRG